MQQQALKTIGVFIAIVGFFVIIGAFIAYIEAEFLGGELFELILPRTIQSFILIFGAIIALAIFMLIYDEYKAKIRRYQFRLAKELKLRQVYAEHLRQRRAEYDSSLAETETS